MRDFTQLIAAMTLREKLAQMTQLFGEMWNGGKLMGIQYGVAPADELARTAGSLLGVSGAALVKAVQARYLQESRLQIPLLFMADVIHGFRTIFPSPLAMSCSFWPEGVRAAAAIAAREASASGVQVTFSPMADLARDARWGRVVETCGEDPWLNALYARAYVEGYQNAPLTEKGTLASCVKHFAGYGAAEAGRDYNTTEIGDYQLRENYLPAYRAAVDAGCRMVMTAFNALNGVPCTANRWLFETLLRGEWCFAGTVITDCTAVYELVPHGYSADNADAARAALQAGVDIEMVSDTFFTHGEALAQAGLIDEAALNRSVERILRLKEELGLFDAPFAHADEEAEQALHLCPAHRAAARDIARRSMVLLKNENSALPLREGETFAVLGPYTDARHLMDIWKCEGREVECVSLADAMAAVPGCLLLPCCPLGGDGTPEPVTVEALDALLAQTSACDKLVLALGEHPSMSGEAGSRATLDLPEAQLRLLRKACALGRPVVAVIFSGRPLALREVDARAQAVLQAWYPGTEGGNALADLLLGRASPSGRLTMSFPLTVGQLPLYYNALPTGRPMHGKDDPERFRSRYRDTPNEPLYPFGYGLTYSRFAYGAVRLSGGELAPGGSLTASATLTNTGDAPATELAQLYLRDMAGGYCRPVRMLKGFEAVPLRPGETREVCFAIDEAMLRYHTPDGYRSEAGAFQAFIGPDAATENGAAFVLRL